nr:C1 family peptidase [uncultured Carboxylicivirga sp.]
MSNKSTSKIIIDSIKNNTERNEYESDSLNSHLSRELLNKNNSTSGKLEDKFKDKVKRVKIISNNNTPTDKLKASTSGDFEITSIGLSQDPVEINQTETITITVNEVGGSAVSDREIQYYLSSNTTISTSDYYIGNVFVNISANGISTESISFVPENISGIKAGDYYVGMIIPDESEYWYRIDQLTITGNAPDLEIPSISYDQNPVEMSQTETMTITINEVGGFSVSDYEIQYYLSSDIETNAYNYYIGNNYISVEANSSCTNSISFIPQEIDELTTGDYYVVVRIPDESEGWYFSNQLTIEDEQPKVPDINVSPTSLTIKRNNNQIQAATLVFSEDTICKFDFSRNRIYPSGGLVIPNEVKEYWSNKQVNVKYNISQLKSSVDWSIYDTPVQDQGNCGSCWAFATVGILENLAMQQFSEYYDLAEQTLVSCDIENSGCNGGWYGYALKYVNENHLPNEVCHPYSESDGYCSDKCSNPIFELKVNTFDEYGNWGSPTSSTVNDLKTLLQYGTVLVSMKVPNSLYYYSSGIYDYESGTFADGSHAVLAVGYNDEQEYFKVRNSWGTDWGENGYFRIAYNDVNSNVQFGGYAVTASDVEIIGYSNNIFTISNFGDGQLTVSNIQTNKSWLSTNISNTNLNAGESQTVTIDVEWSEISSEQSGIITITSNDSDQPTVTVEVTAINNSLSIKEIQETDDDSGDSPYANQNVSTKGIVTHTWNNNGIYGSYIQDDEDIWSGIWLYDMGEYVEPGNEIIVQGLVDEYYGLTEISAIETVEVVSTGNEVNPINISIEEVNEQYESVLVKFTDIICAEEADDNGEWKISDGANELIIDSKFYAYQPFLGEEFSSITGIISYNYEEYKLQLRNASEVKSIPTNILDAPESPDINLYPNPTTGIVNLLINSNINIPETICIYNTSGQIVQQIKTFNQNELVIDLTTLHNGIYLIKMIIDDKSYIFKVVKK